MTTTTLQRARKALAGAIYLEEARLLPAARLKEDLDLDSLDIVAAQIGLEEEFGVTIADDAFGKVVTVADAVALVERLLTEQGAAAP